MPTVTRYGHEHHGNIKDAPYFLSSDIVGRLIDCAHGVARPAHFEVVEPLLGKQEQYGNISLVDVPASLRDDLTFEVTEKGKAEISRIKGYEDIVVIGKIGSDSQSASENSYRNTPGASGTARKASSVAPSGAASRRSARAPQISIDPVVDNKLIGGERHIVVVESPRQCGKTAARDWFVRRHEIFDAAVRFLKARAILVDVVNRDAQIRTYRVSGKRNAMYLEDVVEMAEKLGFEAQS